MLREFAKAFEAEIWTRVRRRNLTSFSGLHFENEPGLTELDASSSSRESANFNRLKTPKVGEIDCPGGFDYLNLQIYLGLGLVDKRPTLASIAAKE